MHPHLTTKSDFVFLSQPSSGVLKYERYTIRETMRTHRQNSAQNLPNPSWEFRQPVPESTGTARALPTENPTKKLDC